MPFEEAIAIVRSLSAGQAVDEAALRQWWEAGQAAIAGRPDTWRHPAVEPMPPGSGEYIDHISHIPQASLVGNKPWEVGVVDLTRVVGFQKLITEERIVIPPDLAQNNVGALLQFALKEPSGSEVAAAQGPGNTFTLTSSNINLRVVGSVQAQTEQGNVFGFILGHGLPWIQVVDWQGRHVLRDGYHRVVGLLRRGITRVPVALVHATESADLGLQQAGFISLDSVMGEQPPLLADFLDERISRELAGPSAVKVIRVTAEEFTVRA